MGDITAIAAFITSVKNATDVAKAIREAGFSLEKAETKLKVAELMGALADAKIQAAEIQELIQKKDSKIEELENALKVKANLVRSGEAYYDTDESGNPMGDPYCSNCWERNHITVHLHRATRLHNLCPNCKNAYNPHSTKSKTAALAPTST